MKLNLLSAARLLAALTKHPHIKDDEIGIIRAGAAGHIPVWWFNDSQITTRISNFKCDLRFTAFSGPLLLDRRHLGCLAVSPSILAIDFPLVNPDFALLDQMQGKYVDDDGNLLVYRHPATSDETVTVTRDQLFVLNHDLRAYAATLTPDKVVDAPPAPDAAVVDQVQPQQFAVSVAPPQTPAPAAIKQRKGKKPTWWQVEYPIHELAQNIGANFHEKNHKKARPDRFATSVHKISKEIEKRIGDEERRTGRNRRAPNSDTIRGYLTNWKLTLK